MTLHQAHVSNSTIIGRGIMKAKVKVATGHSGDWIPPAASTWPPLCNIPCIQIKCDRGCSQEYLGRSLFRYDAVIIMELYVPES